MRPALAGKSSRSKSPTKGDKKANAAIVLRTIAAFLMAVDYSAVMGFGLPAT